AFRGRCWTACCSSNPTRSITPFWMQPSRAYTKRPTLELGAVLPHSNTPHHSAWPDSRTTRLVRRLMRIARVAKDLHGRGGSISRLAPGTMLDEPRPKNAHAHAG